MAKPPTTRRIPHVRSESYRNAVVDNAISVFIEQGSGARLRLTLTRLDVITQWDNVEDEAYPVDSGSSICGGRGAEGRAASFRGLSRLMMSQ